jgi:hypothetical protein
METTFSTGQAVIVHETRGNRARAESGELVNGQAGVIERQMPYDEPVHYEVTLADGGTVYVDAHRLAPAPSGKDKGN